MASAGPLAAPLLPAAALRPCHSALEVAPAEELEDCAGSGAGPARPAKGTPCAKTVSFSCGLAASDEGSGGALESPLSSSAQGLAWMLPRQSPLPYSRKEHVWFNSPMNSAHPITPYAEVYGVHPRFFNFDRSGNKVSSHNDAAAEAAAELEKLASGLHGRTEEPQAPDYSPLVNCTASYGCAGGRSYVAPAPAQSYDLSALMPAAGFGHQPWAACAPDFGFPDTAVAYGMQSSRTGSAVGNFGYAAYSYDYGLMAQQMLAARQSQEVPAGGLPRPR